MLLLPSLAKKIIYEVKKLLDEDIIIVNVEGTIIASTDESRIGTFHEGALASIKEKRKVLVTKKDEEQLKGVKAGLNLPVVFSHDVIGVIGITGEPDRILPYGELLQKMTELLIQESYYSEQMQWQTRMLESFVFDWLQLKDWSSAFIERAQLLNIDLHKRRQVILAYVKEQPDFIHRDIWQLTHIWKESYPFDLFIQWGNDRLLILHEPRNDREKETLTQKLAQLQSFLQKEWGTSSALGIGQIFEGQALKKSYEQAEQALSVASKKDGIVFEEELRLDICLEEISSSTRQEFIKRILQTALKNEELIHTFQTFFQHNMSLKLTAEALHIHINTLHYRIKKLEELTGLNLKHFPDVISLYLALYFLDYPLKK
ncbi:hypothetical protein FZC66_05170 [Priestia megaterium]|nr:hypothetical protein FZC66_05170 [Priestia megaterium]